MWPLYPLSDAIIGITITSTYISCSWVHGQASHYVLKAYTKQLLKDYEIMNGVMYNASKIKQTIQQFLHKYKMHNAYAVLAIENIQESPSSFLTIPGKQVIMQYQLLAISIPVNCIMITPYDAAHHAMPNSCLLSNSYNITKNEALHTIGLYMLGKNCERTA